MTLLTHTPWKTKYSPEAGNLLDIFYIPALSCGVRYDRSTGYFKASALAAAAKGVEGLMANRGHMRLIVGCTLDPEEAQAIEKGESLRDRVTAQLLRMPLIPADSRTWDALELLAWMVANGRLDVKIGVPCDEFRRPVSTQAIFHEKAGIIEDPKGNRIAFNGSINESESGWTGNFDSFHVFTSWGPAAAHLDAEEESFGRLWADRALTAIVMDVPGAIRAELLKFLPQEGALPRRMEIREPADNWEKPPEPAPAEPAVPPVPTIPLPERGMDPRKAIWSFIRKAPALPDGGERIGEATCGITPWPHQVRAFRRMYDNWPPRLLIADEVGLGKTIQAGMVLRQAFLARRAERILILAPKAVLTQWQIELREKFNLNWPIYDGRRFNWYPSRARDGKTTRAVEREEWHAEPCVITSSHLMRRRDRAQELLEDAEPWDLVVLDEAHHARQRGGGAGSSDHRPNQLLRLMQRLQGRTRGLLLLTATPMQVSPIEVWDLLALLGLPPEWHAQAFVKFFDDAAAPMPGNPELDFMARLFRSVEAGYGEVCEKSAQRLIPELSKLKVRKVIRALRDKADTPRHQLETAERRAAVRLMKANTPIKRLISRHTRELLRSYFKAGKLGARIAEREVSDRFVRMTPAEREVYEAVEDYISGTYNNAAPDKRTAIGFVMTIYRRRLASSFYALSRTLEKRRSAVSGQCSPFPDEGQGADEDLPQDELAAEIMDAEDAAEMEAQALALEEKDELEILLANTRELPTDTKTETLLSAIQTLQADGYPQVMVFTQYTDTLDFLRTRVAQTFGIDSVICFSGRGGEVPEGGGKWRRIDREETKARFKAGSAEILLCTDAAAEGLNFQFCGALINYDMPWNPMRVEQRIGRIDRLGQAFSAIRIINLHYEDTVEADVYTALQKRISLFTSFVGKLQPILAKLPGAISGVILEKAGEKERARAALISDITAQADQLDAAGFDLDEAIDEDLAQPDRPEPLYGLPELNRILSSENLLPPGIEVKKVGPKDFTYLAPGMKSRLRVTTDPEYFDAHPESTELWSPGGELFPVVETGDEGTDADADEFYRILARSPLPFSP